MTKAALEQWSKSHPPTMGVLVVLALVAMCLRVPECWTLSDQVHMDFTSPSAKKEVLKATLTQLLLYYTRFVEVLKKVDPELLKEAVTIPSIMYEIKKFKT